MNDGRSRQWTTVQIRKRNVGTPQVLTERPPRCKREKDRVCSIFYHLCSGGSHPPFFLAMMQGMCMWDLSSPPGIDISPPALEAQSLNCQGSPCISVFLREEIICMYIVIYLLVYVWNMHMHAHLCICMKRASAYIHLFTHISWKMYQITLQRYGRR